MLKRARTYLGVIFAIFRRDVRRIVHNPIALILALGICAMPSAYAWYCIEANWDPYQNTGNMKVAVANDDAGYDSDETGHVDVGDQVVEKLKENHQLDWVFTDRESAVNGVYSGEYWAALVMPENFSADFASVLTGHFTKPALDYYVNEKISSAAPEITNEGAQTVQNTINDAFVATVSEKVATITHSAGAEAQEKGDESTDDLTAGVARARDAIAQTRTLLGSLGNTMASAQTSIKKAADTIDSLEGDVPQLTGSIEHAQKLLAEVRSTVNGDSAEITDNATTAAVAVGSAASAASRALGTVSGNVNRAQADTAAALDGAKGLLQTNDALIAALKDQQGANPQVSSVLSSLEGYNDDLKATVASLDTLSGDLGASAKALEEAAGTLDEAAESGAAGVQQGTSTFSTSVIPAIDKSLDELVLACGTLAGAVEGITPTLRETDSILTQLDRTLASSQTSLKTTSDSLEAVEGNLDQSLSDLTALQGSAAVKELATYLKTSPDDIGSFMASPVSLKTVEVYPVKNYGSGVAPFFTNLGMWAGGFILIALIRVRVDPEGLPKFTAVQGYFGRWLFYVVVGLIQALIVCCGDLALGIQCASPPAFVAAGMFTAFVDMNLIYALFYAFRHIGKALAVIILIMQIPGSSGMYPVEMMPPFFQAISPFLPFTYSIGAMREAIGGFYGWDYGLYLLQLGLFFVPIALLIGLGLGPLMGGLNYLFDKKLGETSLLLTEDAPPQPPALRSRTLLHALLGDAGYRERIISKAERFLSRFKYFERAGWVALFAQPVLTFAVMVLVQADVNTKIKLLIAMVVGIIAVDVYLIVISYLKIRAERELSLKDLSRDEIASQLESRLGGEKGGAA